MIGLKKALGPAILAALPFFPTIMFRSAVRKRFLQPYEDAALVQTSMLDGWDNQQPTSLKEREEFRSFLVDAHKAAYVPVCIAGSSDVLTVEPAIIVPHPNDTTDLDSSFGMSSLLEASQPIKSPSRRAGLTRTASQYGVTMRRVTPRTSIPRASFANHFEFNEDGSASMRFNYDPREDQSGNADTATESWTKSK